MNPPTPRQQDTPLCPELVVEDFSRTSERTQALRTTSSALSATPEASQRMLVRFRKQTGVRSAAMARQREDKVRKLGARLKYHWASLDAAAVSLTPEEQARLAQDPEVLSITPDRPVHALGLSPGVAVSALLGAPAAASEYTWSVRMTQANEVWDANNDGVLDTGAPNGSGRTVCVVDSGIDPEHPELKAAYAGGKDYIDGDDLPEDKDSEGQWGGGHGTHVAGAIVAQLGSGGQVDLNDTSLSPNGMVGLAPGARLLVARVLDERGDGRTSDVIEAIEWCRDNGANIVSLSLGSSQPDPIEEQVFQELWDAGVLSIAASGNGGEIATPESKIYPAAYSTVIAVGAVDADMKHPKFSQGGDHLSLVAPGVRHLLHLPAGQLALRAPGGRRHLLRLECLRLRPLRGVRGQAHRLRPGDWHALVPRRHLRGLRRLCGPWGHQVPRQGEVRALPGRARRHRRQQRPGGRRRAGLHAGQPRLLAAGDGHPHHHRARHPRPVRQERARGHPRR